MMAGWIKLHRQIIEWGWYTDSNVKALFLHLLLRDRHQDGAWKNVPLKAGELVTSINSLCRETGMTERVIRSSITKLESTGEISRRTTNKYSIFTINNWDTYQASDYEDVESEEQSEGKAKSSEEQTKPKQTATNNNGNNVDNVDSECETRAYGYHSNVNLSDEEYSFLPKKVAKYKDYIDKLSDHIASTGIKYHSHYATIIKWARQDGNFIDDSMQKDAIWNNYNIPKFYNEGEEEQ